MREMKDCGIEWIGKIPKDWTIRRLCYLIDQYKAGPFGSALIMDKLMDEGQILVYTPEVIAENSTDLPNNKYLQEERKKEMQQFFVQPGDIIFPIVGSLGRAMLIKDEHPVGIINQRLAKFRISSADLTYHYFLWLFARSSFYSTYIELTCRGSIIVNLTKAILHDMPVLIPPAPEQEIIATFLDAKCAGIDSLATDIQLQIDILEQYKRSVIAEAVTKGLNPDTDMKDSGIEWCMSIPQHWGVMPNKYLMKKRKNICPIYDGEDILSLTMNGVIVRDLDAGGKMPASFDGYQRVTAGNLLMCLFDIDVTPRCIGLIKNDGLTSPAYSQFQVNKDGYAPYYYFYYLMLDFTKELLHMAKNLRHSLTEDQLGAISIPVPPVSEQIAIATYLENKCAGIDIVIADKQSQLATLDEYKKSLIFEYVTGKKEVPVS